MKRFAIFAGVAILTLCLAGCGPRDPRANAVLALKGDPARGQIFYESTCASCHHAKSGWSYTIGFYQDQGVVSTVIDGVKGSKMPSFSARSNQDLADLYAYIRTLK